MSDFEFYSYLLLPAAIIGLLFWAIVRVQRIREKRNMVKKQTSKKQKEEITFAGFSHMIDDD